MRIYFWASIAVLVCLCGCRTGPAKTAHPLPRAHAHNDYLHARPLLDALQQGFCSVEADIHLVQGQLLVAHDLDKVSEERTLASLYLRPLQERARQYGGRVYPKGPTFTLLIDIKSDAESTYRVLHDVLADYADMLTVFERGKSTVPQAVTVIISGNRPREYMDNQSRRYAAMDGRLPDLEANPPRELIPLISDNWGNHFQWTGEGPLEESERLKLRSWVKQTHDQGRRIRFWAIPDQPMAWALLRNEGVDLINTDDLVGLSGFLNSR